VTGKKQKQKQKVKGRGSCGLRDGWGARGEEDDEEVEVGFGEAVKGEEEAA